MKSEAYLTKRLVNLFLVTGELEKEFGAKRDQQMEGRVTIASLGHDI